jgi:dihydrofolate reductase
MKTLVTEFISLDGVVQAPGGGYVYLYGSPTLVRSMMAADLVDELLLTIEPIVLDGGKTIWSDSDQALEWELVSTAKAKTRAQVCR